MADTPTPTPLPPPAKTEVLEYRPISAWAIAGLIVSVVFTILVLGSVVFALRAGTPLFLSVSVLLIAFVGAALSFVGQRQIALSEGTRAGAMLASWGLWLSVVSGLGFFVFYHFTQLALVNQSNSFLLDKGADTADGLPTSGFFPYLLGAAGGNSADLNRAFLLTLSPAYRAGDPTDDKKMAMMFDVDNKDVRGKLSQFRDHYLVRAIMAADPEAVKIVPLGVQKWDFDAGSYQVIRTYAIETPEVHLECTLMTFSTEAEEGERRKWFVVLPQPKDKKKEQLTELGKSMHEVRGSVHAIVDKWRRVIGPKTVVNDSTDWSKILPDLFQQKYVRSRVEEAYRGQPSATFIVRPPFQNAATPFKEVNGRLQISYPVQIFVAGHLSQPHYSLDGTVKVVSTKPIDLHNLPRELTWQVEGIEWSRANRVESPAQAKGKPLP